jgi:purine-nucleoside phosphorylase
MYKQLVADDFRKILNLPSDYNIEGVLCHGAMRKKKHKQELENSFKKLGLNPNFEILQESGFYENVTVLNFNGKRIFYDSSYGGAYLCELLHLGSLLGSKKNILIGSCGGLSPNGSAGDIIIPTSSYGNESTTRMYQPDSEKFLYFPDSNLSQELKNTIREDFKVIEGKTITCQAALMESWEDITRWSSEGYVGVEMESATLFAVSNYFKVPNAAILFISDNLIKKESLFGEGAEKLKDKLKESKFETIRVAFQELLS